MMDLFARYVLILIIFSLCLEFKTANTTATNDSNSQIKSTFELLENGEKEIKLSEDYKDIILVLGNTGGGKSTFTQWIAGDNDKLIAKEVKEGTGEFIIEDNNRIGNSTIDSKTIFPELVVETKTNTAFYDCPGFSDTRSTSNDIATTYFIKKVVDHADSVKMIFVISHPSVRKGVDRRDFMTLLKHATELVKDAYKFRNSIAIVATKIDNQYIKQGKSLVLVEDDKIIGAIADFLQEVKQDLEDKENGLDISANQQKFYRHAIKFIDVLLEKELKSYTKIGIFRRPDESGPLSNISLLQEGKKNIETILYKKLNFTIKNVEDFGYTISEKSKNDINDLVEEINKNIWSGLSNVVKKIQEYYHYIVEQVNKKMQSFVISNSVVDVGQTEAQIFLNELSNGYNTISNLIKDIRILKNPVHLAAKTNNSIGSLNIDLNKEDISNISIQGQYFNFLQLVSDKELRTKPWAEPFQGIVTYLMDSKKNIENNAIDIIQRINNQIKSDLNRTVKSIKEHYYKRIELVEIQRLPDELREAYFVMFNMTERVKSATSTKELSNIVYDCIKNLDSAISKDNIISIGNKGQYFEFLQGVSDKKIPIQFSDWVYPLEDLVKYLYKSEKWYTFLDSLYAKFSEYEIQRDKEKYNVVNIEDWGKSGKSQGIEVTKSNFKNFLNKLTDFTIKERDSFKNITVTESQLAELNHALSLTLRHSVSIQCKEPYISIKGSYISIEQIDENKYLASSCKNFTSRIKHINVFALNTVFFDKDVPVNEHGILPIITIIAPKWEVFGTRRLELTGDKGVAQDGKAKDGRYPGNKGDDGKPGEAGKPGGAFFGIGEHFVNGLNLTISTSGGMGGTGQNGGNGQRGTSGSDAVVPSPSVTSCTSDLCDGNKQIGGFGCKKNNCNTVNRNWATLISDCRYKIFGKSGQKGGDGGNGGRGGKGGNAGDIIMFQLSNQSQILNYNNTGDDGENGKGGDGAMFGDNGDDIVAECTAPDVWIFRYKTKWYLKEKISNKKTAYGKNGVNGANYQGIKDPEAAVVILEPANIVNEYKNYLRENLNDRFKSYSLTRFLNKLDNNNNVKNIYNTLGLANELLGIENQFHILNKDKLLSSYQSLLTRISECAKNPKDAENSTQYKKVLGYLYTATLSRIYNLKDSSECNLIIDISGYLDIVIKDIEALKDLQMEKNKAEIINKYKENYKSNIDEKIEEARNFIEKQITPEIDNINSEIDDKVDSLINETIELQERTKEEIKELIHTKQKLESTLLLRGLLGCLKIIGQITSFLGPVGAVAGSVIGAVSTVTESLVLDDQTSQQKIIKLPSGVTSILHSLIDQIKTSKNEKITSLDKLLDMMSQQTIGHSEKLNDTSIKLSSIKKKLSKLHKDKFDLKKFQSLEKELKQELKRKEKELKAEKDKTDKRTAAAIAIIDKFNKALQVGFDIYNKYKNDKAKLDAVSDAIEQSERKFQDLKQYEETIYSIIAPMLKSMGDNLDDIASKLETKSEVSLDITKWQVQSTLKDMALQIQQLTKGFKVETNLVRCIEKLEEVMSTLINIYDRIQSYQEQQNLANYIADISSITASQVQISDSTLNKIIQQLEVLVRSNLVLKQYKTAVDAFQQWVFPFAHLFLNDFTLPSQFELEDNMDNFVSKAVVQIENIKSKIDVYKVTVKGGYDEYILSGEFNSKYVSAEPFYVWKNDQYKDIVSKLLSGQVVVLKADITKSAVNKEAIKFSFIELYFKAINETIQSVMDNTLKGFDISMTHLGNSYYRYADKIYVITSNRQTILYSFEKDSGGEPIRKNHVYDKIKIGDLMLSPYALWEIKLINSTSKITFNELEIYKDEINLELDGYGSYVIRGVNIPSLIDDRYRAIDTYNQLDVNGESKVVKRYNVERLGIRHIPSKMDKYMIDTGDYMVSSAGPGMSSPINNALIFLTENAIMVAGSITHGFSVKTKAEEDIRDEKNKSLTKTKDEIEDDLKVTLNVNEEVWNPKTMILAKRLNRRHPKSSKAESILFLNNETLVSLPSKGKRLQVLPDEIITERRLKDIHH